MKKAIITGSFDPITSGHADLILRTARIFDKVVVTVLTNCDKKYCFSHAERLALVESAVRGIGCGNVSVVLYNGLTSSAAHEVGANIIVRGARNATDFDYENELAAIMKRFDSSLETVILPASPAVAAISSTYVRELLKYGSDLGDAVPDACRGEMLEMYKKSH